MRVGVIRTVGSTGGVITSAGLIFAASMFGLIAASITTMAQAGFTIGIGIVIDTFLVRTITVPAVAALLGQKNWWPSKVGQTGKSNQPGQLEVWLNRAKQVLSGKPPAKATVTTAKTKPVPKTAKPLSASSEALPRHSLPLFGLTTVRTYDLAKCLSVAEVKANGIGNEPVDHLLTHSLPLFGLGYQLLERESNGNGKRAVNG